MPISSSIDDPLKSLVKECQKKALATVGCCTDFLRAYLRLRPGATV
jgi:hypothetical protein